MQVQENYQLPQEIQIPESFDLYKHARSKFVIKVYIILAIQLLITTGVVALTMNYQEIAKFQSGHFGLVILAWLIALVSALSLTIKRQLSETYPINMAILTMFTLAESYIVSSVCSFYDPNTVLLAAGVTASATVGITLYAIYSKSQFTSYWQGLTGISFNNSAIGWSFFMTITFLTLINFWFINIPLFSSFVALCFAIIYSAYLVIDTQLILGKGKHNISLDNYILGSVFLYLDIIGLFLEILRILGKANNN